MRYKTFINMSPISKARSGEREEHGYQDHISGTCGRKALAVASQPPQKKTSCYQRNLQEISHTDHSAKQTEKWVAIIATGQVSVWAMSEVSFKQTKVENKWAMGKYTTNVCINHNCFREREREIERTKERKKNNNLIYYIYIYIYIVDNPVSPT